MTKKGTQTGVKWISPVGRILYPKVFEPDTDGKMGDGKYKLSIAFRKDDAPAVAMVKELRAACLALAKSTWPELATPPELLFHDGDKKTDDDGKARDGFAGSIYITVKSKFRPGVVDANLKDILDANELYSGCYGKISVVPFTYDMPQKGVSFRLCNVQKVKDGERIGGGSSKPEDDFAVEGAAPEADTGESDDLGF